MDSFDDRLAQQPETLLVLLPGAFVKPDDFRQYGFVQAVRARRIAADILSVDLDYSHVMARSVVSVLHDEVVEPATRQGYRAIWLVGISLGGLNALMFAARHSRLLAGVHLLSPYPGTRDILQEIRTAGGPLAWRETALADGGDEREAWKWLVDQVHGGHSLPVTFGCGSEDRFIDTQRMFAQVLPPQRVAFVPGEHDWPTWQRLWAGWLDMSKLPRLTPESAA